MLSMLEYSSSHFFILFNKQYRCIYSKWVLDAVSPTHTGLGTTALIQQCHSIGNQDQKRSSMPLKSKGDFEHTVRQCHNALVRISLPIMFQRDLQLCRETGPFFKDSDHKYKPCSKVWAPYSNLISWGFSVHTDKPKVNLLEWISTT